MSQRSRTTGALEFTGLFEEQLRTVSKSARSVFVCMGLDRVGQMELIEVGKDLENRPWW